MRTNSGSGDGTNNLLDPTLKEHERERGKSGEAALGTKSGEPPRKKEDDQKTTELGSNARKSGQEGRED